LNGSTGASQDLKAGGVGENDPGFTQDTQRGLMEGFDFFIEQHIEL
jgi:hypothetical protein